MGISHRHWATFLDGIAIDNQPIVPETRYAIIDSGSSHIFLTPGEINKVINRFREHGVHCKFDQKGYDVKRNIGMLCYKFK